MSDKPAPPPSGQASKPPASAGKPAETAPDQKTTKPPAKVKEIGGPEGPEPTRYGDWERKGRVSDF